MQTQQIVHLHVGTMWSGKTTRLLAQVRKFSSFPQHPLRVAVIKFAEDTRYTGESEKKVISHRGESLEDDVTDRVSVHILGRVDGLDHWEAPEGIDVIAIEEGHFATRSDESAFGHKSDVLLDFIVKYRSRCAILISALDSWAVEDAPGRLGSQMMSYTVKSIDSIVRLLTHATHVTKKPTYCLQCSAKVAVYNRRRASMPCPMLSSTDRIQVGGAETYCVVCATCNDEIVNNA